MQRLSDELKRYHRQYLQRIGLSFIDDNDQRKAAIEARFKDVRGLWEAEAALPELARCITAALEASTTDNEQQIIGKLCL
jgi:hypothetical protein